MAIENLEILKKQYEVAGFPSEVYNALDEVSDGNYSKYQLEHRKYFDNDRMYYYPQGNISKNKGYYNGFLAVVVNNMPENPFPQGNFLHSLESRLQNPPTWEYLEKKQLGHPLNEEENHYTLELQKDLLHLSADNRSYFLQLVALYDPLLPQAVWNEIGKEVNEVLDTQIRKQWFSQDKGINVDEAYLMLKDPAFGINFIKEILDEDSGRHWVGLNYSGERTKYGNYTYVNVKAEEFNAAEKLQSFAFVGADSPTMRQSWAEALERGEKVKVVPINQEEYKELYISANAAYQTFHIQNVDGQLLKHDQYLTEMARQQRERRAPDEDDQVNRSSTHSTKNIVEEGTANAAYNSVQQMPFQRQYSPHPKQNNNIQSQGRKYSR